WRSWEPCRSAATSAPWSEGSLTAGDGGEEWVARGSLLRCCHVVRAQLVELEHYLSDVAPLVNVTMRGRRLRQRECAIDARMDAALAGVTQQRLDLGPEDLLCVPQVPNVGAGHRAILIHQGERSEPRPAQRLPDDSQQ